MSLIPKREPELRFPQFTDGWQIKKLGDMLEIGSGRDYKHLNKGEVPVYGTGGLMLYVNDYLYDGKSIGIGRKGTIDKPQFLTGKFWTVDTLFYTRGYKDSVPEFLYAIFQKINWQKWNEASGVPSLSKSTIEKIKVGVPGEVEQQKIADYMVGVDSKLTSIQTKVAAMHEYKKGVMQALFSGKLRFKDANGNQYPDWEEKELADIVMIKTGKKDVNQGNPKGEYPFFTCAREHTYSDEYSFDGEAIMIAGNGEVGLCTYYKGKFEAYQRTYVLQDFKIPAKYLFIYLKEAFQTFAESQKQQGSMPYIKLSTLQDFKVPVQSDEEQQKIADFLSALDDKIKLEEAKLASAKEFKKALLQRMFV